MAVGGRRIRALPRPLRVRRPLRTQRRRSPGRAGDDRRLRDALSARPRGGLRANHLLRRRRRPRPAFFWWRPRVRAVPGALAVKIAVDILLAFAVLVALLSAIG